MLSLIRIVLVNTSHPGNIGAAARAMKTMGLSKLYLVQPRSFPDPKALELASGADDVIFNAQVVTDLPEALAGCRFVVGTSARERAVPVPLLSPREMGIKLYTEANAGEVALVFGREHAGLTNKELSCCHQHVMIPANPEYTSLNLAAAVQVLCYELRMAASSEQLLSDIEYDKLATADEIEGFYSHLQQSLETVGFLNQKFPKRLMQRMRRLFNRTRLEQREVNILRGILSNINAYRERQG